MRLLRQFQFKKKKCLQDKNTSQAKTSQQKQKQVNTQQQKQQFFAQKKLHKRGEIVYFAFFYLKSLLKKN